MQKVQLDFMVVPEQLAQYAEVINPIKVRILNPTKLKISGVLGLSGVKLAEAGIEFYFAEDIANSLITQEIAEKVE